MFRSFIVYTGIVRANNPNLKPKMSISIRQASDQVLTENGFLSDLASRGSFLLLQTDSCPHPPILPFIDPSTCQIHPHLKEIRVSRRGAGLYYGGQHCNSNWRLLGGSQDSAGDERTQSHRKCEYLTLHCCACGLWEEWNKQEVDEVDEGQGIVPEQASCRNKSTEQLTSS